MRITFTAKEREVVDRRLSAPDCIAEAITDWDPAWGPAPAWTKAEAMARAEVLFRQLEDESALTLTDELDRAILEDAIDGSVFGYFIGDALADGDMSPREAAAWRRTFRRVEAKLRRAGINACFPE